MVIINKDIVKEFVLKSFWNTFGDPEYIILSISTFTQLKDGFLYVGYLSQTDGIFNGILDTPLIPSGNIPVGINADIQAPIMLAPVVFNHCTFVANDGSTTCQFEGYRMKIID